MLRWVPCPRILVLKQATVWPAERDARKAKSLAEKRAKEARRLMVTGKRERKPSAKVRLG